ncbi:MAG: hypothetical protein AMXMBFR23_22650 [Chloroflexota bacterium]
MLLILIAAALGAVLGRVALEVRQRVEAGEPPETVDLRRVTVRIQDLVPGLVAAMRVRDVPWSWLHIPSWLAAFAVNVAVAAVGGDLSRLREMVERAAMGVAGLAPEEPREPEAPWEPPAWEPEGPETPPDAAPRWDGTAPDTASGQPGGFAAFDR